MAGRKNQSAKLAVVIVLIGLTVIGCIRQENKDPQVNVPISQETEQIIAEESAQQSQNIFVQMLANHPLHRHGELSPDNRYYAYEERSSIILVQLPTAMEYEADKTLLPKVLFTAGMREKSTFAELEADYARRLRKPLLTQEELNEASNQLRSVYDWQNFYYQKFSQDGRYLAYLGFDNFGRDRTCTVYVLDLLDNFKQYTVPVKENSEYAELSWQADSQTLEIYLPLAEAIGEGESLALRRQWHLPSGQHKYTYYTQDGTPKRKEIALADAQKIIAENDRVEAEQNKVEEEWAKLTVEELVAALTPAELAAEYEKYKSLHIYDQNQVDPEEVKAQNAPPEEIKKEILERGLPQDLESRVAKEFQGWENMLAYSNEAIIAMYDAVKESDTLFRKGDAYRQAVRSAYLGR